MSQLGSMHLAGAFSSDGLMEFLGILDSRYVAHAVNDFLFLLHENDMLSTSSVLNMMRDFQKT